MGAVAPEGIGGAVCGEGVEANWHDWDGCLLIASYRPHATVLPEFLLTTNVGLGYGDLKGEASPS